MSFPNDPKRPRGNPSTGTNPQSQQHLRTWPLRIASWMSQQCLEQYSNMSTQDVVQQFRTYFDQWFTVIDGADSLNKEQRVLYAKNNCSQNLVVLAVVLACRINDVPEARQYPNILDAARRVLSSYWGPEYRGSLVPPSVESFSEEFLLHASTVSDFFYYLNPPSQTNPRQQQQQHTTQNQPTNYNPNPIPPSGFPFQNQTQTQNQNQNQNHPPHASSPTKTQTQTHSPNPSPGYHHTTSSPQPSPSSTLLDPSSHSTSRPLPPLPPTPATTPNRLTVPLTPLTPLDTLRDILSDLGSGSDSRVDSDPATNVRHDDGHADDDGHDDDIPIRIIIDNTDADADTGYGSRNTNSAYTPATWNGSNFDANSNNSPGLGLDDVQGLGLFNHNHNFGFTPGIGGRTRQSGQRTSPTGYTPTPSTDRHRGDGGGGGGSGSGFSGGNGITGPGVGGTVPPPPPPGGRRGGGGSSRRNGSRTNAGQFLAPPHPNFNSPRGGRGGSVPQGNVPNPNPNPNPNPGVPQSQNRNQNHQQTPATSGLGGLGPNPSPGAGPGHNPSNPNSAFGSSSTNGGRQRHRSSTPYPNNPPPPNPNPNPNPQFTQSTQPTQPAQSASSTSSAYNQASFDPFALYHNNDADAFEPAPFSRLTPLSNGQSGSGLGQAQGMGLGLGGAQGRGGVQGTQGQGGNHGQGQGGGYQVQGQGQGMAPLGTAPYTPPPTPPLGGNGRGRGGGSSSRHGSGGQGSGSATTTDLGGNGSPGRGRNGAGVGSNMGSGHSNRNGTSPTGARANNAGGGGGGGGGGGNGNSSHGNSTSPPNFIPPGNHNSRVQSQASTQLTPPRLQWLPTPYPSPYPIPYTQLTSPHGLILPNTPLTPNPDPRFPGLAWEPGVWPPVPLGHPIPIRVHHHLLPNTVQLDLPVLQWDITQLPEKARVLTGKCLLVRPNLEEPAVVYGNAATELEMGHSGYNNNNNNNKIYKVWIGSDDPTLGWWMTNMWGPLIIEKERGKEVSVWDVLEGIYRYLAKPLTHWDYEKVVGNEGVAARVPATYSPGTTRQYQDSAGMMENNLGRLKIASQRRMKDLGCLDISGSVWKGGWARDREPVPEGVPNAGEVAMVSYDYRRSDVLGSMKKFVGLRSMVQDDGTWMLYLGLASGGMVKV